MTAHVCPKGWHTSNLDWEVTCYCGAHICDVGQNSHSDRDALRLIAAAPDLLHVAEMVLRGASDGALYGFAEAAVRKAKGEP